MQRLRESLGLGSRRAGGWRQRSDPVRGRRRALKEEVGYWEEWLTTKGGQWHEDFEFRFDPEAEVEDPALREALTQLSQDEVSILDVGAGPVTAVGYRFPGKELAISAVDPLGGAYARLLAKAGVEPPVRTGQLEGERLARRFGTDRFDVAYSRNALDHAVDPVLIVEQMLEVIRPGGFVVLRHRRNEAVDEDYVQLHQWNFDERDGQFVIWRPDQETDMTARLAGDAEVSCRVEDGGWVAVLLKKL